jgi:uncharacterized protein (DUF697 family)
MEFAEDTKPVESQPIENEPVETTPKEQKQEETKTMTERTETKTSGFDYAARTKQANHTVNNYMIGSLAVGLVPVPLFDLAAVTAIQLTMLHRLAKQYEIPFKKETGKSLIASLLGGVFTTQTAVPVASVIKFIPIVGQASGAISVALLSGATTYAVGKVFIQHFESGGTFLDFDPEKVRDYFAEQLQEGQLVAADLKNAAKA